MMFHVITYMSSYVSRNDVISQYFQSQYLLCEDVVSLGEASPRVLHFYVRLEFLRVVAVGIKRKKHS